MAERIEIKLFDGFSIHKGNKQILKNLSNTRKTKLFVAYLLANRDRAISHQELFELLWSGEDYANPATALRTLLYRFRSMIAQEKADDLAGAIISRRGTYQWNSHLDVSIDALDFLDYSQKAIDKSVPISDRQEALEKSLALYTGSLLPDFCSEPWLISKSAFYRDRYIEVVLNYIELLKSQQQYAKIVEVCDAAVSLAGSSEIIDLEKSMAKLCVANPNAGREGALANYYKQVKDLSIFLREEADKIQDELENDTVDQKAYLCDYNTFKEIYRLQRRLQSRSKATIFLGIIDVRVEDESAVVDGHYVADDTMKSVVSCCQRQLRCGDSMCVKSNTEIIILFPAESYEDAMGVLERLKIVSKERVDEDIVMVYRVRPLKNAKE